jgi:hypothetical protein
MSFARGNARTRAATPSVVARRRHPQIVFSASFSSASGSSETTPELLGMAMNRSRDFGL